MERKKQFGARLRELRQRSGLTLRALADVLQVHFSYLSKIENGRLPPPSEHLILEIARVLKADGCSLVTLSDRVPSDVAQTLKAKAVGEFGLALRKLREQSGMTQDQLASKADINYTYISKIENAAKPPPSLKVLWKLANILNVDIDKFTVLAGRVSPNRRTK